MMQRMFADEKSKLTLLTLLTLLTKYALLRSVGAQAFLLPANGETERGVKTIDIARNGKKIVKINKFILSIALVFVPLWRK